MNLPSGVPQNSACVLIAMREYFNDPLWEDADLVAELRMRNTPEQIARNGSTGGYNTNKMPALLERAGMFTHEWSDGLKLFNSEGSNADRFLVMIGKGVQYTFPRNASCVLSYWTNKEHTKGHTMCLPLHVAICFIANCKHGWSHIGIDPSDMQYVGVKR